MTAKEAKEAFIEDKRIDFKSRHGDFLGLSIDKLIYEKNDAGYIEVSFVLKDGKANTTYTANLSECEVVA